MYTYQKTLLYACKNIKEAIKECDKIVEYSAYSSKFSGESCILITERILALIEEKTKLIKLKEKLKRIVKNFTLDEKKLFLYKYVGVKQDFSDISKRQYYRNQQKLLKNFASTLRVFDLNEEVFNREYLSIPFIHCLYNMVEFKDKKLDNRLKKSLAS